MNDAMCRVNAQSHNWINRSNNPPLTTFLQKKPALVRFSLKLQFRYWLSVISYQLSVFQAGIVIECVIHFPMPNRITDN